ncbi:MAG TPA: hypothetical protein VGG39_32285 [Polyangiaceae bacterium]|jgi:hypothetical protein
MKVSVSLCLNHAPFAHDRVPGMNRMIEHLELRDGEGPRGPFWVHDIDYRKGGTVGKESRVDFTLNQWRWAVKQPTTHHAFATDDLELVPRFWEVLDAILEVAPNDVIGLLSNHPDGPGLSDRHRFYATNSWVVGPMYVVPHSMLEQLLAWPDTYKWDARFHGWSDDATLNAWVTFGGPGRTLHPLPTPIEHDPEGLMSTWSHTGCGGEYSRERLSWRKYAARSHLDEAAVAEQMLDVGFWRDRGGPERAPRLPFPITDPPPRLDGSYRSARSHSRFATAGSYFPFRSPRRSLRAPELRPRSGRSRPAGATEPSR